MEAKSKEAEEWTDNEREAVVNLKYYFYTMAIEKVRHMTERIEDWGGILWGSLREGICDGLWVLKKWERIIYKAQAKGLFRLEQEERTGRWKTGENGYGCR